MNLVKLKNICESKEIYKPFFMNKIRNTNKVFDEKIKFAIIIKTYMKPIYFKECLLSIINQTYDNYSIIINYQDEITYKSYLNKYDYNISKKYENRLVKDLCLNGKLSLLKTNRVKRENDLLKENIKNLWSIKLNNTDIFTREDSLNIIYEYIKKNDKNIMVTWKHANDKKSSLNKNQNQEKDLENIFIDDELTTLNGNIIKNIFSGDKYSFKKHDINRLDLDEFFKLYKYFKKSYENNIKELNNYFRNKTFSGGMIVKIKDLDYDKMINYLEDTYLDSPKENSESFIFITSVGFSKKSNQKRIEEYKMALKLNSKNIYIKKMIVFYDTDIKEGEREGEKNNFLEFLNSLDKVEIHFIKGQLNFIEAISYSYKNFYNEKIILSNCDMFITNTIRKIKNVDLKDYFLCLTKWDIIDETTFEIANKKNQIFDTCQDVWIYQANDYVNNIKDQKPIYLGKWNCENELARMLYENGYELINPCREIVTIHIHNENCRNQSQNQRIPFLHPVGLGYLCEISG